MGNKYADDTIKYKLIAKIDIDGVVNEADIVGALFGQTEGLLDQDMELKQLQRTGRIGRIDLEINNKSGQTRGTITSPSSLNKIETAIIAATIESVDRVGACSCTIKLERIIDVRKDKRDQIARRAAEIMKNWDLEKQSDDFDISSIVEQDAQRGRVITFGSEKLSAGPGIYDSNEIILVEGRADVANLLKMDIDNTIALGGTSVPNTIINLCKTRTVTALLDGDRGGDMILKELLLSASVEYVARAPYKKEVEDLNINEVREAIANKTPILDAEFMTEKYSVYSFLKKNERFDVINKQNGKGRSRSSKPKQSYKSKDRKKDDYKSKGKGKYKDKRGRKGSRDKRHKKRREKNYRAQTTTRDHQFHQTDHECSIC
jgi:DNA primase